MSGELVTVEYAGPASRQVGNLPWHDVRAWWVARDEGTLGRVKLAAGRELKRHLKGTFHVECVNVDMNTYKSPHIDAMITFRVLTREQFAERKRLASLVVLSCTTCGGLDPCNYLRMADGTMQGACFTCLRGPLADAVYSTVAWIKADGRLQI